MGRKKQGSALQPAGAHLLSLLGRNGHDGSAVSLLQTANVALALPDPLLLAPDPFSWAHRTPGTAQPGQLLNLFYFHDGKPP